MTDSDDNDRCPKCGLLPGAKHWWTRCDGFSMTSSDTAIAPKAEDASAGHVWPPASSESGRQPQTAIPTNPTPERGE